MKDFITKLVSDNDKIYFLLILYISITLFSVIKNIKNKAQNKNNLNKTITTITEDDVAKALKEV